MKMKEYYNDKYALIFFSAGDFVRLRLYKGYRVPSVLSKKIG